MLKSVAVSRQGPRSMAPTFRPAWVSSWARRDPAQPRPMITTSFFGRLFAILSPRPAPVCPAIPDQGQWNAQPIPRKDCCDAVSGLEQRREMARRQLRRHLIGMRQLQTVHLAMDGGD